MTHENRATDAEVSAVFRMPTLVTITGRSSSITNSFVQSIIPVVQPSPAEIFEVINRLGMSPANVVCVYCGDPTTEWDHLNSLVENKQPTGYWSTIRNLVPACGKCNQSKGSRHWKTWMMGPAPRSPASRGIPDMADRIQVLERFEHWADNQPVDFKELIGSDLWLEYETAQKEIAEAMIAAQRISQGLKAKLDAALRSLGILRKAKGRAVADGASPRRGGEGRGDKSRYTVSMNGGSPVGGLGKGRAILMLFQLLIAHGAPIDEIVAVLDQAYPKLKGRVVAFVAGELDGDTFSRALELSGIQGKYVFRRERFFCKDHELVAHDGSTYSLTSQWGVETDTAIDALLLRFTPGEYGVDCKLETKA